MFSRCRQMSRSDIALTATSIELDLIRKNVKNGAKIAAINAASDE